MDVQKLREVAEAATPGPWDWGVDQSDETAAVAGGPHWQEVCELDDGSFAQRRADAEHIATFDPATVLALLDVVAAAEWQRREPCAYLAADGGEAKFAPGGARRRVLPPDHKDDQLHRLRSRRVRCPAVPEPELPCGRWPLPPQQLDALTPRRSMPSPIDPDDDIAAIRERRQQLPDSAAAEYLASRGMDDEVADQLARLEVAVRSLAAAFDGELDHRQTNWMPYLAEKSEVAGDAAQRLTKLFDTARELPT